MLRSIACSSARAPCLLSGSLRLPHLGECTQEGQPLSHPQLSMASRVALSHCTTALKPRSLMLNCAPKLGRFKY